MGEGEPSQREEEELEELEALEKGQEEAAEGSPFDRFESFTDLLTDKEDDSQFAENEGLVDPFVEYRQNAKPEDLGTELTDLQKHVKEYQDALIARLWALPTKNTSRARELRTKINQTLGKWNRLIRL